jgi:hypothetical protein
MMMMMMTILPLTCPCDGGPEGEARLARPQGTTPPHHPHPSQGVWAAGKTGEHDDDDDDDDDDDEEEEEEEEEDDDDDDNDDDPTGHPSLGQLSSNRHTAITS